MSDDKTCSFCKKEPAVTYINTLGEMKDSRTIGFYCRQIQLRKRFGQ